MFPFDIPLTNSQVFGGGPLSLSVGNRLADAGVPLYGGYGGSEFGNPTLSWDELPDGELRHHVDWQWLRFSKAANTVLDHQGDGTYELVIYVSFCHLFPDVFSLMSREL